MCSRQLWRRAFTLLELLVVISIVALLISILLPALNGARQNARAVVCSTQIIQLVRGLITYDLEYDRFPFGFDDLTNNGTPPPGGYVGNNSYDRVGWWWFHSIRDYTGGVVQKNDLIRWPSRKINDGIRENPLWGNYGVNVAICKNARDTSKNKEFAGKPLTAPKIPFASGTLLIVDCGYSIINWRHVTDKPSVVLGGSRRDMSYIPGLWINEIKLLVNSQVADALEGRHANKTVNVGFADGHVSTKLADTLYVEEKNGGYQNLSPLWLPK